MKKFSRLLSIIIAFVVVLGSLSFSMVAFGEEEVLSEVLFEEEVTNEGENEGEVVEEELLNSKIKPPKEDSTGNLKLHKRIQRSPKHVDANIGDGEFTVTLTGPIGPNSIVRTVVIDKNNNTGEHGDFKDLPYGTYIINETSIYDPDNEYDGWRLQKPGNHGDEVDPEIEINKKNATFNLWLVNKIDPKVDTMTGEIAVTKKVKDHNDVNLEDDHVFTFRLFQKVQGEWVEVTSKSPMTIKGNGTETFEDLPLGEYKVVEDVGLMPNGFTLDTNNDLLFEIQEDGDEFKAEFTNKKAEDTPPPTGDTGSLTVHKRIKRWVDRENDKIDSNLGDDEFTITLSGPLPEDGDLYDVRTLVINQNGNTGDHVTFNGLPYGSYILEETYINDNPVDANDYYIVLPGNHGKAVGDEVIIESKGAEQRWIINKEAPPTEPSWKGKLQIEKFISGIESDDLDLGDFEFELYLDDVKVDDPKLTDGEGIVVFEGLSEGTYEIRETDSKGYLPVGNSSSQNPFLVEISEELADGDTVYFEFTNSFISLDDIVVRKFVANDTNLSGFTFRLYSVVEGEEEFVAVDTTGPNGIVVFANQPDGDYVIYEDIKVGYEMGIGAFGSNDGKEFTHSNEMKYPINITNRKLPPPPPPSFGRITVEKVVQTRSGNLLRNNNTRFYFILELRGEGNTWMTVDNGSILGNGTLVFDDLEYGDYRVREVNIDDDFELFSDNNIIVEVEDASSEEVEFINRREPVTPPDDDDDDPDNDDPEDEPEDEEEEEEEVLDEVEVIEEPTPEAQPVPEIEEEVEVVEEPTPEAAPVATLPKTGVANPLAFSALGGILLGLGLFLKKKE